MRKPTAVAADTCVLIDLAAGDGAVECCFDLLRGVQAQVIVLPTVIQELTAIARSNEHPAQQLALKALQNLRRWGFSPENCAPVGHGIVEEIGRKIRSRGLLPDEEKNDSYVIAEAALRGVTILISNDSHIADINQASLKIILDACDVACPLILRSGSVVRTLFK